MLLLLLLCSVALCQVAFKNGLFLDGAFDVNYNNASDWRTMSYGNGCYTGAGASRQPVCNFHQPLARPEVPSGAIGFWVGDVTSSCTIADQSQCSEEVHICSKH